ncbi:uncharacterized protein [Clytia hemisphaerica]|uniref:uncharacterized protein n=1 Tax=Clytia hemisphaerica TaxID=252671 RepID=UPI0034D6BF55
MGKDEHAVLSLMATMENKVDPFTFGNELIHIANGGVASSSLASHMKEMKKTGEKRAKDFINNNILAATPDIHSKIENSGVKFFTRDGSSEAKSKNGEIIALKDTKNLFAKLLLLAQSRNVDMKDVLQHSLRPFPMPLATIDGNIMKTVKSKLLESLEKPVGEQALVTSVPAGSTLILDAMAIVQSIRSTPKTFGELSRSIFKTLMSLSTTFTANRIDFVGDRYPKESIKGLERAKRASSGSQLYKIINSTQPVPRQWKKFLSRGENKEELLSFLRKHWSTFYPTAFKSKTVLITDGSKCFSMVPGIEKLDVQQVNELSSDHEEADSRMLLHYHHAKSSASNIVIRSPDTDVFIIAIHASFQSVSTNLFFATGTSNSQRIIDLSKVRDHWGELICKSLIGFHAFTGCDSVSSFHGKGKKKALSCAIKEGSDHLTKVFSKLGETLTVSDDLFASIQKFVCSLYGKESMASVNDLRYVLFKSGKFEEEFLPPTSDVLFLHSLRANFQAFIWKHANIAFLYLPSFTEHGWLRNDGNIVINWMDKPIAPDSVLNFIKCKCTTGCKNNRCSCVKALLKCTDLCGCIDCQDKKDGDASDQESDVSDREITFADSDSEESDIEEEL